MAQYKKQVEAVLFAVGKEISSERVASLCSLDVKKVEKLILELQKEYSSFDNSLQIVQKNEGWKLTVRDEFVPLVSNIVSSTELERPLMETLAVIAWRYPVVQSEIIKLRSAAAYEHMKLLEEQGFIAKERFGRTFKVKLTKKFFEYFDLPSAEAKQAFLKQVPASVLEDAKSVDKEANEVVRLVELDAKEKAGRDEIKDAMQGFRDLAE
jgi:segregation and condensation protein B